MYRNTTVVRFRAYFILLIFSIILMGICAGRIAYTTNLPEGDPVNGGVDFYDPSVVLLLVTSIAMVGACTWMCYAIFMARESRYATRVYTEALVMGVLWFLLIVGTGMATSIWPNLGFCMRFTACQILQALLAFAWLSWLVLTPTLGYTLWFGFAYRGWTLHVHGWEDVPKDRDTSQMMSPREISGPQMYSTQFDPVDVNADMERRGGYATADEMDRRSGRSGASSGRDRYTVTSDGRV